MSEEKCNKNEIEDKEYENYERAELSEINYSVVGEYDKFTDIEDSNLKTIVMKSQIICSGQEMNIIPRTGEIMGIEWDLKRTLPFFDESLHNINNPTRKHDGLLVLMDVEYFIEKEIEIMERMDRDIIEEEGISAEDYFYCEVDQENLDKIKRLISDGVALNPFVLEFDENGMLKLFQEGRHRIIALNQIGIKKVPIWLMKERTREEMLIEQYGSRENIPNYISL